MTVLKKNTTTQSSIENANLPEDCLPLLLWSNWHYKKQDEFIEAVEHYWEILFVAGNGTGKTHIFYWSLINLALGFHPFQFADPPLTFKILINDFEHGLNGIFVETCMRTQNMPDGTILKRMLPDSQVKSYWSKDNRSLTFNNGSLFVWQTSEQKKKLHSGTNFDVLGCDEEQEYQVYDESKRGLRTAKGGGRILHAFTPPFDEESKQRGPSWTKFQLVDPFELGTDTDIYVVKAAMHDNPAITSEYIRKFSKGKTEEQIRIQIYGDYPTWGKMIFTDYQDFEWSPKRKEGHILKYDFEVPWDDTEVLFEMAVDWHGSKPVACIWMFEYRTGPNKGDVVVFDEISPTEGEGLTISEAKAAIHDHEGWRDGRGSWKIRRYGDPKMRDKNNALISGFNPWDEFRSKPNSVRLTEGWNRDPGAGYSVVNDYLRGKGQGHEDHPRLFIKENVKTLRHNLKNHYWQRKGDSVAVPDAKFNDYCVSLKYVLQGKREKKRIKGAKPNKLPLTSMGDNYQPATGTWVPRLR